MHFTLKAAVFQADACSVLSHFEPTATLKQFTNQMGASLTALTLEFLICTNRPDEIDQQGDWQFREPMDGGGALSRPSAGGPQCPEGSRGVRGERGLWRRSLGVGIGGTWKHPVSGCTSKHRELR